MHPASQRAKRRNTVVGGVPSGDFRRIEGLGCHATPTHQHTADAKQARAEEHEAAGLRLAGIGTGAVHLHLGMTYAKLNDKTDAQAQLKKVMALAPNGKVGKVVDR
jgi:hypothetical protein